MKKFDVHVYIPVRFKVAGIEAADLVRDQALEEAA